MPAQTRLMGEAAGAWYWFVLSALAVWRITHCLHLEHGPWGVLSRARALAAQLRLGDLFTCFYCLSLWTAAPVAFWLAAGWPGRIIGWLSLSASAVLIELRAGGAPP